MTWTRATWLPALPALLATSCMLWGAPPPPVEVPAPPPKRILAVLPVESDVFPKLADSLNLALETVELTQIDETVRPTLSLEMIQLAIECVEESDVCYAAAGRSVSANRMVFARLSRVHRHAKRVIVTLTLFDVDTGTALAVTEREFRSERRARQEVVTLIDEFQAQLGEASEVEAVAEVASDAGVAASEATP